jgi:hypothetical protein
MPQKDIDICGFCGRVEAKPATMPELDKSRGLICGFCV